MISNMVFGLFVAKVLDDLITSRKIGEKLNAVKDRNDIKVVELEIKARKKRLQKESALAM